MPGSKLVEHKTSSKPRQRVAAASRRRLSRWRPPAGPRPTRVREVENGRDGVVVEVAGGAPRALDAFVDPRLGHDRVVVGRLNVLGFAGRGAAVPGATRRLRQHQIRCVCPFISMQRVKRFYFPSSFRARQACRPLRLVRGAPVPSPGLHLRDELVCVQETIW